MLSLTGCCRITRASYTLPRTLRELVFAVEPVPCVGRGVTARFTLGDALKGTASVDGSGTSRRNAWLACVDVPGSGWGHDHSAHGVEISAYVLAGNFLALALLHHQVASRRLLAVELDDLRAQVAVLVLPATAVMRLGNTNDAKATD